MIDEVLYVCNFSQYHEDALLDSSTSHHICLHKSWFSTYQAIDNGVTPMWKDVLSKTVGIGSIRIKMFDGIVSTLAYVRHVWELKNNLISLVVLDSGGYKSTCQGGLMNVSKGVLVVMKATKIGNLYKLEGRTKFDEAAMVYEKEIESYYLGHQWLGHMSEKGITVLIKVTSIFKNLEFEFLQAFQFCKVV